MALEIGHATKVVFWIGLVVFLNSCQKPNDNERIFSIVVDDLCAEIEKRQLPIHSELLINSELGDSLMHLVLEDYIAENLNNSAVQKVFSGTINDSFLSKIGCNYNYQFIRLDRDSLVGKEYIKKMNYEKSYIMLGSFFKVSQSDEYLIPVVFLCGRHCGLDGVYQISKSGNDFFINRKLLAVH